MGVRFISLLDSAVNSGEIVFANTQEAFAFRMLTCSKPVNEKGAAVKQRITKDNFVIGVIGFVAIIMVISFGIEQA
jgi:hypothetical protein